MDCTAFYQVTNSYWLVTLPVNKSEKRHLKLVGIAAKVFFTVLGRCITKIFLKCG